MRFFQRFVLDKEWLEAERKRTGNYPSLSVEAGNRLTAGMLAKGYVVLRGSETINGVSTDIIAGAGPGKDAKDDFYSLAKELDLKFRSGDYYTEA